VASSDARDEPAHTSVRGNGKHFKLGRAENDEINNRSFAPWCGDHDRLRRAGTSRLDLPNAHHEGRMPYGATAESAARATGQVSPKTGPWLCCGPGLMRI